MMIDLIHHCLNLVIDYVLKTATFGKFASRLVRLFLEWHTLATKQAPMGGLLRYNQRIILPDIDRCVFQGCQCAL